MRFGANILNFFPWAVSLPGLAAYMAEKAGYEFLQILPLRGINKNFLPGLPVRYLEEAWNNGSFIEFVKGIFSGILNAPKIHDVVLFGCMPRAMEIFRHFQKKQYIEVIGHNFADEFDLLEINPGLWLTPEEIIRKVNQQKILVLDLYHLRRDPRPDEIVERPQHILRSNSILGDWHNSLAKLLPYTALIHISPHRSFDELGKFIQKQDTELEEMLRIIKNSGYNGDFVVEATLGLQGLNMFLLQKTMKDFLIRIREVLTV